MYRTLKHRNIKQNLRKPPWQWNNHILQHAIHKSVREREIQVTPQSSCSLKASVYVCISIGERVQQKKLDSVESNISLWKQKLKMTVACQLRFSMLTKWSSNFSHLSNYIQVGNSWFLRRKKKIKCKKKILCFLR